MSERIRTHLEGGMTHAWGPGIKNFKGHCAEQEMLGKQKSLGGWGGWHAMTSTSEHLAETKRFLENQDMES